MRWYNVAWPMSNRLVLKVNMDSLPIFFNADRSRRVLILWNSDGTFGFREERWSDEPLENCWIPSRWPNSHCNSVKTAVLEAVGRIKWMAESVPDQETL